MLFSLDHKLYSSDYDSDSDSVDSENEPLCRCLHNKKKKTLTIFSSDSFFFFFFSFGTFLRLTKSTKITLMVFKLWMIAEPSRARSARSGAPWVRFYWRFSDVNRFVPNWPRRYTKEDKTLWESTLRRRGCGLVVNTEEWQENDILLACKNSRFSSLLAAREVSQNAPSSEQRGQTVVSAG